MRLLHHMPAAVTYVFTFAFGAVVGSFLNVVIHRLPRDQSLVRPRSRCPSCERMIAWFDNIPVLSWFVLRGRCRHCKGSISPRYVAVETLNGGLWVLAAWWFGFGFDFAAGIVLLSSLVALAFIDLEHYILPDRITLPGIVVGFAFSPVVSWTTPLSSLIGAATGVGVLLFIMGAYWLVRRVEGMGWGDVKMAAMLGAFLGWKGMIFTLLASSILGGLVGLLLVATGMGGQKAVEEGEGEGMSMALPFGAFLAVAAAAALFVGPRLLDAYLGWSTFGDAY